MRGNLVVQEQGDYLVAYWAPPGSKVGEVRVGSIHVGAVGLDRHIYPAFVNVMRTALSLAESEARKQIDAGEK